MQSRLTQSSEENTLPEHESSKKSQSFLSSVFSSHNAFSRKNIFATSNEEKQWKNEKSQGFLSSVISSNTTGLLTDLSSKLEAALSLSLDALDSDSSSRSDETSRKNSAINEELSNSSSQADIRRISLPITKTEQLARHRYTKRRGTKHKDRSVYGQPEISPFEIKQKSWKDHSQESLDTVDSGQSLGNSSSLSASATDYRTSRNDPFYVFRHTESVGIGSESDPCGQSTSLDSSDAESIPEGRGIGFGRSGSGSSLHSWASSPSNDSQPDDVTLDAMEFMRHFVKKVFVDCSSISFEEKAKFGELCRHEIGRLWFARCVNGQRVHNN
ncbi:suppressor protein SRP40-like [Stegodyphus dumicola]|uniref:suppressor protein SRP40-like n=1 Tax=Stegodyphus dumicola TaxID=202533 RepID=UPI0015B28AD5|nr:suppressor protein SRP40-like [Stegodyphus dumicola]